MAHVARWRALLREVKDFPRPGILFQGEATSETRLYMRMGPLLSLLVVWQMPM